MKGSTLQLCYDDIIIYNKEIHDSLSDLRNIWRFDGPAINNVSNFASNISTTNILSDTYSGVTKYEITLSNEIIYPSNIIDNSASFIIPQPILENLTDGSYNIEVSVTNIAENSDISNIIFFVDKIPPIITTISLSWGSILNINESQNDGIIYINASENIGSVQVTLASDIYSSNSIIDNSASVIIPSSKLQSLTDGSYNILIYITNNFGNDTSANSTFNVDFTSPIINDISFSWGNILNIPNSNIDGSILINTTDVENGETITATLENENYDSIVNNNSATIIIPSSKLQTLVDGSYNIIISSNDIAGNIGTATFIFGVDKTPPTIHDISFSWGDLLTINKSNNTGYIYITTSDVVDDENITATIGSFTHTDTVLNNNATITIPSTTPQSLTDGNYDAVISANDINGNTGTNSASFGVDKIPPIINLMTLSWGSILNIEKASTVGYVSTIVSGVEDSQQITATLHGDQYTSYVYDGSANIEIPSSKLQSLSNTSYTLYATVLIWLDIVLQKVEHLQSILFVQLFMIFHLVGVLS